jgi:hypothetical protein
MLRILIGLGMISKGKGEEGGEEKYLVSSKNKADL